MSLSWVQECAVSLAKLDNVVGVALGGSRAREMHVPGSDVDLGLYYRDTVSRDGVLAVLKEFHDPAADLTVTSLGEWGPWINGGAWFRVDGLKADLLYRSIAKVERTLDEAAAGQFNSNYQPGHPAGFHSYHLVAEVANCNILVDPNDELGRLQAATSPFPEPLRDETIRRFLWEADFQLTILERVGPGSDPFFEQCSLSRVLACVVQVLYAVNRRWYMNEKRAVAEIATMPQLPLEFVERVARIAGLYDDGYDVARTLVVDTATLARSLR